MKRLIVFIFLIPFWMFSQQMFYQDICYCGVTGAGFSTSLGSGGGSFQIYIESGSTIKKAFLFAQRFGNPEDASITLNGINYLLNNYNQVSSNVIFPNTPVFSAIHAIDVTYDINASQTMNNVSIPQQLDNPFGVSYGAIYLYVIYEKASLTKTNLSILLNNYDMTHAIENYSIQNLNPINTSQPVGFATYTDRMGTNFQYDGSYIYVENNLLGLLEGTDQVNNSWGGAGVKGHFYYQNQQLFGLDDDTPDNIMGGSDGLADISMYINNNTTSLDWKMEWEITNSSNRYNIYSGFFLTYTSPCDTFSTTVTSDTTICYGEQLQLNATGGQSYEWATSSASVAQDTSGTNDVYGLSCSNCPNPIFSGDSSAVYTVRIWNNDSCSVVKPVRVGVSHPQKINVKMFRSICSFSTGKITVEDLPDKVVQLGAINPSGDTINPNSGNTFTGLTAGDYSVFYVDTFGCSADTLITVEPIIDTEAAFRTNPIKGTAPIQINLTNQSQNATDYSWWINDEYQGNSLSGFYTDTSGVYDIELIAWKNDSICADTVSFTVIVFDSLVASLPNIFTPNKDGTNDFFNVSINLPVRYQLSILNRWGNVVFKKEGDLQKGTHDLWNGGTQSGELVTDGTYFYAISFELDSKLVDCEITNCEVKKEGFLEVRK